jgi:predicted MPP superfamily phosphohydrolase
MNTNTHHQHSALKFFFVMVFLAVTAVASAEHIKIIHGPYLQNVKPNEATIVFETDSLSMAWVEIGPNDGTSFYSFHHPKYFDTVSGIKKISKLHAVTVTGLKPGTTYRYRVFGKELLERNGVDVKFGRTASTDVYTKDPLTFTTFDTQKPETSFIMVNDIHQAKGLMTKLFNYTDYKNKDFVVFNGDMVSWLDARDTLFTGFMNEAIRLFAQEKPIVYTRGNHETRGKCANDLQLYFNPHEPHLYYSFREGPIYFIVLDTGEDKCDDDIEYNGLNDFDTYRTSQAAWISTVADDEDFKTARFHVVICHMPPLIAPDSWHGQRDVMDKFVPELNKLGIDLMLCGHLHEYVYAEPNEQVKFPVLVNSNTGIADVQTKGNALSVTVYDVNGKVTTKKEYKAKEK